VPGDSVRILLCDDAPGFAGLIESWCADEPGVELAGATASATEMLAALAAAAPDVVLLDFMLPEGEASPALVDQIRERAPGVRIVLISSMPDDRLEAEARRTGADAFSSKVTTLARLFEIVVGTDYGRGT
jgi:DNA-binding NarL/FixJ family response regulator